MPRRQSAISGSCESQQVDVCLKPLGVEADLTVTTMRILAEI